MHKTPTFDRSFLPQRPNAINLDAWPKVMEVFQKGDHKKTILAVLNYINADQVKKYGNKDKSHFEFRSGSARITFAVDDDGYSLKAPFLKIADGSAVPFLRQVAEMNFRTLMLPRLVLEDDAFVFRYSSPLDGCSPYKLYDLFKNVCNTADSYDDFCRDKFNVEYVQQPDITPFKTKDVQDAQKKFKAYIDEGLAYADYFEGRRLFAHARDALSVALYKIDYYMRPQAILKGDIEKIVKVFRTNEPDDKKVGEARKKIEELGQTPKEKFIDAMYEVEIFVPESAKMNAEAVRNFFKRTLEDAEKEIGRSSYESAYFILAGDILSLFFYNDVPPDTYEKLVALLEQSADQLWADAVKLLFGELKKLFQ